MRHWMAVGGNWFDGADGAGVRDGDMIGSAGSIWPSAWPLHCVGFHNIIICGLHLMAKKKV